MALRRHVVYLRVGGSQGAGFLIAPNKLVTALHVIVELDAAGRVTCDAAGQPAPLGQITCTYYSTERNYWSEHVEFVPGRDRFSILEDFVILTVTAAQGAHVWSCAEVTEQQRGAQCSTYGFPASHGDEGAPIHGSLTGVHDPHSPNTTTIPVHRAWFEETAGPHGYAARGFSGAPLVVADRVVGLVRSFLPGAEDASGNDRALGSTIYCTPITPVLVVGELEPVGGFASGSPGAAVFEGPNQSRARRLPYFCGRERELADLERLLCSDDRLVCVVAAGLGGVGKTYLAEEFVATRASDRFPDGAAWLDGHQLDADLIRVSRRFGWHDSRDPSPAEANTFLASALKDLSVLLVVDDFEPQQADSKHIPRPGQRCRTLVTTRAASLDVDLDATRLDLGVWTPAACREYLRTRCDELEQVADDDLDELAKFVEWLPLGVRLLVAVVRRRRGTSLVELLAELRARPLATLDGYRGAHRGIAATFSASYEMLSEDARRGLLVLAACARQTRREIVEAIVGASVGPILDELLDRGLASHVVGDDKPWGMHDLVRMFVREQPGYAEAERAHLQWANALLDREWKATQHAEFARYVVELRHTFWRELSRDVDEAAGIYDVLGSYLMMVGRHREAIDLGEGLSDRLPAGSEREEYVRQWLATSYMKSGASERALEYGQRALERASGAGDVERVPSILNNLGAACISLGRIGEAEDYFNRAIESATEQGRDDALASSLGNLGHLYEQTGRPNDALPLHQRCYALNHALQRWDRCAIAMEHGGDCLRQLGKLTEAMDYYSRALSVYDEYGMIDGQASVFGSIATCHQLMGQVDEAIATHRLAIELARAHDNRTLEADRTGSLGVCQVQIGQIDAARESFAAALAIDEALGRTSSQSISLGNIGFCLQCQGDVEGALTYHRRAFEMDATRGEYGGQLRHLQNIVKCNTDLGRDDDVFRALTEALHLAEQAGDTDNQAMLLVSLGLRAMDDDVSDAREYLTRAMALFEANEREPETLQRIRDLFARLEERRQE